MGLIHSPNKLLYRRGAGHFLLKKTGETGHRHMGNIPDFTIEMAIETDDHYSSMSSSRLKDDTDITGKGASASCELQEFGAYNVDTAMLGDGVQAGSQAADIMDKEAVTLAGEGIFMPTGHKDLTYLEVAVGTISGTFSQGETITGKTSAETATVAWADNANKILYCVEATGSFTVGEVLTGGTSSATAALTRAETRKGAVVLDASTPTERFVEGTDYMMISEGGMIAKLGAGISGSTVYVYADYPSLVISGVRALANSEVRGELLFIGTNAKGPRWNVQAWDVSIKGGSFSLISEDRGSIPLEMEFLADTANHPDEPFFRMDLINAA